MADVSAPIQHGRTLEAVLADCATSVSSLAAYWSTSPEDSTKRCLVPSCRCISRRRAKPSS